MKKTWRETIRRYARPGGARRSSAPVTTSSRQPPKAVPRRARAARRLRPGTSIASRKKIPGTYERSVIACVALLEVQVGAA